MRTSHHSLDTVRDWEAQFQARHPIGTRAGLALALPLYTAQRRSDVAHMGWQRSVAAVSSRPRAEA